MSDDIYKFKAAHGPSPMEVEAYRELVASFRNWEIPNQEVLKDLPLFLTRSTLGHVLFLDFLYQQILDVPGSIFEFGVRWGRSTSVFLSLRALREPFNFSRFIYGFDTFEGFPSTSLQDGNADVVAPGGLSVPDAYKSFLENVLAAQERLAPRSESRRFLLIKGDATESLPRFLTDHPHAMCALAYFDFDLYEPTLACLIAIEKRLTRNSILVFDQFTLDHFPGETLAVREFLESRDFEMRRHPLVPYAAYAIRVA